MKTRKYNKKSQKMYAKGKFKKKRKSLRQTPRERRYQKIISKRFDSNFKDKYKTKKKKSTTYFFDIDDMILYNTLENQTNVKKEPKTLVGKLKTMLYTLVGY